MFCKIATEFCLCQNKNVFNKFLFVCSLVCASWLLLCAHLATLAAASPPCKHENFADIFSFKQQNFLTFGAANATQNAAFFTQIGKRKNLDFQSKILEAEATALYDPCFSGEEPSTLPANFYYGKANEYKNSLINFAKNVTKKIKKHLHFDESLENLLKVAKGAAYKAKKVLEEIKEEKEEKKESDYSIKEKNKMNIVTQADMRIQNELQVYIHTIYPTHIFYSEENAHIHQTKNLTIFDHTDEYIWVLDPLDGTSNYASNLPFFSMCICVVKNKEIYISVIFDLNKNEMFYATKNRGAFLNGQPLSLIKEKVSKKKIDESIVAVGVGSSEAQKNAAVKIVNHIYGHVRSVRNFGCASLSLAWIAANRLQGYVEYGLKVWDFAAGILILREAGGIVSDSSGRPADVHSTNIVASCSADLQKFLLKNS